MNHGDTGPGAMRNPGLDALRGLAILGVVAFHVWVVRAQWGWWWRHTVEHGAHGVGLFFAVSALTLALTWERRAARDPRPQWAFWARRWWRIAPLFYVVLGVTWGVGAGNPQAAPPGPPGAVFSWQNLLAHLTFIFGWLPATQNSWIGVEWSIAVEVSFYALFPWIMNLQAQGRWRRVAIWGWGLALAWPWILRAWRGGPWPVWATGYPAWSFFTQLPAFLVGLWVFRSAPPQGALRRFGPWAVAALFALTALRRWPLAVTAAVWAVPVAGLTWGVWHGLPWFQWIARSRLLRYIGLRSYSWYLTHWILLTKVVLQWGPAAGGGTAAFWIRLGAALLLTAAAGEVGYQLVERPGQALGRRLIQRWGWAASPALPRSQARKAEA
ncbi:MAG: acyltransferase [Firmicutes bacterium]|nr:acyltransferase [Alicyclobacillaceae bacterium]MCL6496859.1 acyltransferase [Bacillota bacterium]